MASIEINYKLKMLKLNRCLWESPITTNSLKAMDKGIVVPMEHSLCLGDSLWLTSTGRLSRLSSLPVTTLVALSITKIGDVA